MKINNLLLPLGPFPRWIAGIVAIALLAPSISKAEDITYSRLLERLETLERKRESQAFRIDSLEKERQSLHAQFASFSGGAIQNSGKGCDSCSKSWCNCDGPEWVVGYEMTVLRPYISNITLGPGFDNEYGVGHRFTAGREGSDGFGIRGRYWMFNHGHAFVPAAATTLNLDLDVVDIEATLRQRWCEWDFMVSGGIRYGRNGYNQGPDAFYFEGTGPTGSIEATREFGSRGLYLLGNFRASMLIGEIHTFGGLIAGPPVIDDEITTMLDSQLGVGWSREMGRGELHLKAVMETQFWLNDTIADATLGIGSNLGLIGATLAAEIRL